MDSQPIKRFREKSNSDNSGMSSGSSNDLTSKEDEQFDCTIPPLISEVFLAHLKDVNLLKTCRLVCISWNIAACRSLRNCSLVRVEECSPRLSDLTAVLLRRSFGALNYLPSPFEKLYALGSTFTDPVFIDLVLQPNIVITELFVPFGGNPDKINQSQLGRILTLHKTTITNLGIFGIVPIQLIEELSHNEEMKLLSLKSLDFKDICTSCSHILLLKNILSMCKPNRIELNIGDGDILISLLTQDKLANLKHLELKFCQISTQAWKHLGLLKFSRLRKLILHIDYPENQQERQQLHSFYQNVATSLEDLTTNIQLSNDSELTFPLLKNMNVWNSNTLSDFTQDRFPCLETLFYNVEYPMVRPTEDYV